MQGRTCCYQVVVQQLHVADDVDFIELLNHDGTLAQGAEKEVESMPP